MRYFTTLLFVCLFLLGWCAQAQGKNEYLGDNWRNCDSGTFEPYVEKSERDVDYFDNDSSHDDDELRYGFKTRKSYIGNIPLLRELFVTGVVFILKIKNKS